MANPSASRQCLRGRACTKMCTRFCRFLYRHFFLTGVPEYGLAVAFHVLIESDAYADLGQDDLKRGLPTFKRMTPEIVAVKFDQIECVKEYAFVMAAVADAIERSNAVVITGNRLAVDDAGARPQAGQGLDDQREAIGEIIAGA